MSGIILLGIADGPGYGGPGCCPYELKYDEQGCNSTIYGLEKKRDDVRQRGHDLEATNQAVNEKVRKLLNDLNACLSLKTSMKQLACYKKFAKQK